LAAESRTYSAIILIYTVTVGRCTLPPSHAGTTFASRRHARHHEWQWSQWQADAEFCPRLMVGAFSRDLPMIRRLAAGPTSRPTPSITESGCRTSTQQAIEAPDAGVVEHRWHRAAMVAIGGGRQPVDGGEAMREVAQVGVPALECDGLRR
jgi:hypothetical protein